MSAIASTVLNRRVRFYEAAAGKKVVMAVTGVILFGYVLVESLRFRRQQDEARDEPAGPGD